MQQDNSEFPPTSKRLVTITEITDFLKISKTTLWRMVKRGDFPQGFKINNKDLRWKAETLEKWIEQQQMQAAEHTCVQ